MRSAAGFHHPLARLPGSAETVRGRNQALGGDKNEGRKPPAGPCSGRHRCATAILGKPAKAATARLTSPVLRAGCAAQASVTASSAGTCRPISSRGQENPLAQVSTA